MRRVSWALGLALLLAWLAPVVSKSGKRFAADAKIVFKNIDMIKPPNSSFWITNPTIARYPGTSPAGRLSGMARVILVVGDGEQCMRQDTLAGTLLCRRFLKPNYRSLVFEFVLNPHLPDCIRGKQCIAYPTRLLGEGEDPKLVRTRSRLLATMTVNTGLVLNDHEPHIAEARQGMRLVEWGSPNTLGARTIAEGLRIGMLLTFGGSSEVASSRPWNEKPGEFKVRMVANKRLDQMCLSKTQKLTNRCERPCASNVMSTRGCGQGVLRVHESCDLALEHTASSDASTAALAATSFDHLRGHASRDKNWNVYTVDRNAHVRALHTFGPPSLISCALDGPIAAEDDVVFRQAEQTGACVVCDRPNATDSSYFASALSRHAERAALIALSGSDDRQWPEGTKVRTSIHLNGTPLLRVPLREHGSTTKYVRLGVVHAVVNVEMPGHEPTEKPAEAGLGASAHDEGCERIVYQDYRHFFFLASAEEPLQLLAVSAELPLHSGRPHSPWFGACELARSKRWADEDDVVPLDGHRPDTSKCPIRRAYARPNRFGQKRPVLGTCGFHVAFVSGLELVLPTGTLYNTESEKSEFLAQAEAPVLVPEQGWDVVIAYGSGDRLSRIMRLTEDKVAHLFEMGVSAPSANLGKTL